MLSVLCCYDILLVLTYKIRIYKLKSPSLFTMKEAGKNIVQNFFSSNIELRLIFFDSRLSSASQTLYNLFKHIFT